MALILTYQDLFPSSTIMKSSAGNGSITIPGAGDARLLAPNGANCQFYAGDGAGKPPLLYEHLSTMWREDHPPQPLFFETKLSVFTGTTNLRIAGLTIFVSDDPVLVVPFYAYEFGWYKNDGKIHVWYDRPSTESELFTAVTLADPASTPHVYRIYWNPYNRPLWINELSLALQTDYLCFAYSVDNGVTWASLGTRLRDFDFMQAYVGLYVRKWETSAVSAQADFAYFKAQQYNAIDAHYLSPDDHDRSEDQAAFEDAGGLLNLSGPERYDALGTKDDVVIKEAQLPMGFEDTYQLPVVAGRDARYDYPQIREDYPLGKAPAALEEGLFVQLDNTDYIHSKFDSEGRELLGNYGVRHILFYDATLDPWHTHGAGFYGAGRDGVLYYNGVACGPGSFGTVAGGIRRTAWAAKNEYLDFGFGAVPTITTDDEITCTVTPTVASCGVGSNLRWFLTGDFDIQVDYQIVSTGSGPNDNGILLMASMDWSNEFYVRRKMWTTNAYDKDVKNNGSWASYASVATSDTSGKLRLVRVGSVVSSYYWSGSAWVQIGSNYTMTYLRPVFVQAYFQQTGGTSITAVVKIRNFTINSGTTTNLIGWAREAAGTYRGSQAAFPQHALIVSSGNSLDIIDADTDKLWMSFRGGVTKLLGGDGNYYVPQVAFKDGTLLLCYRTFDTYGTVDGYGYWIDFTLDFARCHRGPSYNDAGLYYNVELTTGVWPRDSANGAIAWRNSNRGESASHYDNWQFQNSRANWCDILHDGGYQYRLIANNGGVYIAQWERWKFEGSGNAHLNTPYYALSNETTAMRWAQFRPTSKDMLYHNRTKLYIAHYATWSIVLAGGGGVWAFDHDYTLAGTPDPTTTGSLAQDSMALDDAASLLFYARNEGVYVMDLTTGISTLIYGKVGSGATYEVLPEYALISSVKLAMDGAVSLLVVGMARPDCAWAVNRATHTVYWRGFKDDSHQPLSLAVSA